LFNFDIFPHENTRFCDKTPTYLPDDKILVKTLTIQLSNFRDGKNTKVGTFLLTQNCYRAIIKSPN
ncbi:MAG: hypothetical protein LBU04_06955, partial [Christensenellaceae bacterium]|nr:hypothetical protein [Christensenellaceae bacterium]